MAHIDLPYPVFNAHWKKTAQISSSEWLYYMYIPFSTEYMHSNINVYWHTQKQTVAVWKNIPSI